MSTVVVSKFTHDPQARLDYDSNWTQWLAAGETIVAHTVVATGSGPVEVESSSVIGGKVVAWVSGGTVGSACKLTFHIETNAGRKDDRSMTLTIKDR